MKSKLGLVLSGALFGVFLYWGGSALTHRYAKRTITPLDSFAPQTGLRAYIWRMVSDPERKRWVATGLFYGGGGPPHWYVRGSQDGGKTWATWDDTSEPAVPGSEALGAAFARDGSIYINGTGGHDETEVMRKSVDQGKTWQPLHVTSGLFGGKVTLGDNMFIDSEGQIFELGSAVDVAGNQHWWVRKQRGDGDDWQLLNDFQGGEASTNGNGDPQSMVEDSRHTLYVTGWWSSPVNTFSLLTTQLSRDGGKTWYLSDTYTLSPGEDSRGRGMFITPNDHLFVAGHSSVHGVSQCLVRRSLDSGQSWATVDQFLPEGATSCSYLMGVSVRGELYVAGHATGRDGFEHRLLRLSRDDGGSWTTVLDDAGRFGKGAAYTYVNVDSEDQLILTGSVQHPTDGALWTVDRVSR